MSIRFVPVALIAAMIALLAVGGAALAFGIGGHDPETRDDILERAAGELGIDAQVLKDALEQAESEVATEHQQVILDDLVSKGVITQDQADEAMAWLEQKPTALDDLVAAQLVLGLMIDNKIAVITDPRHSTTVDGGFQLPFQPYSVFGSEVTGKMAEILGVDVMDLEETLRNARDGQAQDARDQAVDELIDKMVEDGRITAAEGEQIKAWLDAMPDWLQQDGMLARLFFNGIANEIGVPFPPDLDVRPFGDMPGPAPRLEIPEFHFSVPSDPGTQRRYFYRGPDGEFDFNGEVPEDLQGLLDEFNFRFDGSGGLDGLFPPGFPFAVPTPEPTPADDNTDVAQKGA